VDRGCHRTRAQQAQGIAWTGRGEESGSSLVGLLLVLVVLGVVAVVAITQTSMLTDGVVSRALITPPTSPNLAASSTGSEVEQTAPGLARQVACRSDYQIVLTADETMFAQTGSYASTIAQLVAGGYLQAAPSSTHGYTIALASTPAGEPGRPAHGVSGGVQPTGGVTVNGVVGTGACSGP
jgi:hypothetical protein